MFEELVQELNLSEEQASRLNDVVGKSIQSETDKVRTEYSKKVKELEQYKPVEKSAEQIEREIRAYKTWPQSRTTLGSVDAIITKAHVDIDGCEGIIIEGKTPDHLNIHCGDGWTLGIDMIKPIGKKEMPIQAFLAGYKDKI